jgi:hypothetical protein
VFYAGGGGGGKYPMTAIVPGGNGGGGVGSAQTIPALPTQNGSANTGGGGGGGTENPAFGPISPSSDSPGGDGGSGVVIVRAPSARGFIVTPCTNTVSTTPGGCKVARFTVSGCLTLT